MKRGTVIIAQGAPEDPPVALIAGVTNLRIDTQEQLDQLHRLIAEGKPLPLKPANSAQRVRHPKHYSDT